MGSFSSVHKSAGGIGEKVSPAKDAIRQGLGYMFSGTSKLGSQADEWLSYLLGRRFVFLSFIGRNAQRIGSGQKSMVDQGQDWVKQAKDAINEYFQRWLNMLPYLFYYWNRTRNTLFGMGISDIDLRDDLLNQILSGNMDEVKSISDLLLDNEEFKKTVDKASELVQGFSKAFKKLAEGDNKDKAEKALQGVFEEFTKKISTAMESIESVLSDKDKLKGKLNELTQSTSVVEEKFKENQLEEKNGDQDDVKKAKDATTKLLNFMVNNLLELITGGECSEGEEDCVAVTVSDDSDESSS